MTIFKIFSQPAGPVGRLNQPVHWVRFFGTTVRVLCFALFILVPGHSKSEFQSVYLFGFLTL